MILRAPTKENFDAIFELFAASERGAFGQVSQTKEEVLLWLTSPKVDLARDIRLAYDGDRLVGYGDVDAAGEDPVRWWCDLRVDPDANSDAVVDELLSWMYDRAEGGVMRVWAPSAAAALRSAYERHGFRRIRGSYRMEIELDGSYEPQFPPDVEVRTLRPGEKRAVYDAHNEAFADSWEHVRDPFEEWEHYFFNAASFDPSLWFLAWTGDELAGVSLCRVRDDIGWVGALGVRRPWRRRGLGRALLLHSFNEFQRRGFARVGLGVDAESLTGAHKLYESVGMHVTRELDFFEKSLEPQLG